jgi:AcrR family transcriptional regulator
MVTHKRSTPGTTADLQDRTGQLSLDEITAAAMAMARHKGLGRLTMRRLADELGVTAAAIYYHVPGKAELVELVADAVAGTLELPGPEFGDWSKRMRKLASDFYAVLSEYPGVAQSLARNQRSRSQLRLTDFCVGLLREAGFSQEDALHAFAPIRVFTVGEFLGAEEFSSRTGKRRLLLQAAGPADPRLEQLEGEIEALDPRETFLHGIELFLDGLRAELARQSNPG